MSTTIAVGRPPGSFRMISRNEETAYLVDGWSVDNPSTPGVVQFGILQSDVMARNARGQNSALAQFRGIVVPGLIMVSHVFRGLKRPLYADDCMTADAKKLIHAWKPIRDFEWPDPFDEPRTMAPPKNCVFVVIASVNERHCTKWPEVYGWIDRWNWVDEDSQLPGAPLNWSSRYEEKLFTRVRSVT